MELTPAASVEKVRAGCRAWRAGIHALWAGIRAWWAVAVQGTDKCWRGGRQLLANFSYGGASCLFLWSVEGGSLLGVPIAETETVPYTETSSLDFVGFDPELSAAGARRRLGAAVECPMAEMDCRCVPVATTSA